MRFLLPLFAIVAAVLTPVQAQQPAAETWPPPLVKIIVPFAPGATPDIMARLLADRLQQTFPTASFIVENKPGASGNIGVDAVAKAPADGSTLGISNGGPLTINTLLFSKLRYNPATDIAPISQLVTQPSVLVVTTSSKINSVAELLAAIKNAPGKFNYGSIGYGSVSHLAMEAIADKAGGKLVHVPLKGSPAVITELLKGDVQMACMPASAVVPQMQSGQLKILAVTTARRSKFLPDIPTLKESGVDVEADAWMGLIAPGGVSPALIARIHDAAITALDSKAIQDKLALQQIETLGNTPAEFRAVIAGELKRWTPLIKSANIKID